MAFEVWWIIPKHGKQAMDMTEGKTLQLWLTTYF